MCSTIGWQRRSGGLPSRNAIFEPFFSCKKRFRAVSTTVLEISSGSMKFSALLMARNTSSFTRSGMLWSLSHSVQEYLSHSST